jgi:hypothetical protein
LTLCSTVDRLRTPAATTLINERGAIGAAATVAAARSSRGGRGNRQRGDASSEE